MYILVVPFCSFLWFFLFLIGTSCYFLVLLGTSWYFLGTFSCFLPFLAISFCFFLFLLVSSRFLCYLFIFSVSPCLSLFLPVSSCFFSFLPVYSSNLTPGVRHWLLWPCFHLGWSECTVKNFLWLGYPFLFRLLATQLFYSYSLILILIILLRVNSDQNYGLENSFNGFMVSGSSFSVPCKFFLYLYSLRMDWMHNKLILFTRWSFLT